MAAKITELKAGALTLKGVTITQDDNIASSAKPGIIVDGELTANHIHNAVWNDLADSIQIPEGISLIPGKCYNLSNNSCELTSSFAEQGILGIHSDTYGFKMGSKEVNCIDMALTGFVLAYVDREYPAGTPLTCMADGNITCISPVDLMRYPWALVGYYYKPETNEIWNGIKVNGRHWVRIK